MVKILYWNTLFVIAPSMSSMSLKIVGVFEMMTTTSAKLVISDAIAKNPSERTRKLSAYHRKKIDGNVKDTKWPIKMITFRTFIEVVLNALGRTKPNILKVLCVDWNIFIVLNNSFCRFFKNKISKKKFNSI